MKRGTPSQSRSSTAKAKRTPLPALKVEPPTGSAESNPLFGQGATDCDETSSDAASELDDEYTHAKVCDRFWSLA